MVKLMFRYVVCICLYAYTNIAFAGALDQLNSNITSAIGSITTDLQQIAIAWLSALILIQMVITNYGLLKSGAELEAIFGKLIGSILWFAFCFYIVLNGGDFIEKVSKQIFTTAGTISGASNFDPGKIIGEGAALAANLVAKINQASGITDLFIPAILGGLLGIFILMTAALISFKVFLIQIETALIIMLAPLSFAFLGLNALKDQGIAPLKSLISLVYRILLLAVFLKAMGAMSDNLVKTIDKINSSSIDGLWSSIFAAITGYVLIAFLVWKSDSIASSLASGSTNLGTADVAGAAAAGAAAGAVMGSAGAAIAGDPASKARKLMSDFIQGGAGGSVKNAATKGAGGMGSADTGMSKPAMSPSASNGGNMDKSMPQYSENAKGVPIRPGDENKNKTTDGKSNEQNGGESGPSPESSGENTEVRQKQSGEKPAGSFGAEPMRGSGNADSQSGATPREETGFGAGKEMVGNGDTDAQQSPSRNDGKGVPGNSAGPTSEDSGSGAAAEIGGKGADVDIRETLSRMESQLGKQNAPRKATFQENVGRLNNQIAQEKATTHVSINANASD